MSKTSKYDEYIIDFNFDKINIEITAFQYTNWRNNQEQNNNISSDDLKEKNKKNSVLFKNLFWIAYYLNEYKGYSINDIHLFFTYKEWTSWSFSNFRSKYYRFKKIKHGINIINNIDYLLKNKSCDLTKTSQEYITEIKTDEPAKIINQPLSVPDDEPVINLYSTLEESREKLLRSRERAKLKKQNDIN